MVKQCHLHHPPVITIFIGGINHSQMGGWWHCFTPIIIDYRWFVLIHYHSLSMLSWRCCCWPLVRQKTDFGRQDPDDVRVEVSEEQEHLCLGRWCQKAPGVSMEYWMNFMILDEAIGFMSKYWMIFTLIYVSSLFFAYFGGNAPLCLPGVQKHTQTIISMSSWSTRSSTSYLENSCNHTASSPSFQWRKTTWGHYNPSRIWLSWYTLW